LRIQSQRKLVDLVFGDYFLVPISFLQQASKSIALAGLAKYIDLDKSVERLYGFNFRYGSGTTNFYFEFAYEKTTEDEHYILGYGGQHRLKDDLFVKFGLQTEYRDRFELKSLIPRIDINWNLFK